MEFEKRITTWHLDKGSDTPLYLQVRDLILKSIREGDLVEGGRLPPIRRLAEANDLNVMTVARAYKELTALGVIAGRGALGTFVSRAPTKNHDEIQVSAATALDQDGPTASVDGVMQRDGSTFLRMLQASELPGVVPLTRAYPDASAIDIAAFNNCLRETLEAEGDGVYAYAPPDGLHGFKGDLIDFMREHRGLQLDSEDIVVTNGAQQALSIIAQCLLQPGDSVVLERPTYFGAIDLFRSLGLRLIGVGLESDGPNLQELEDAVRRNNPKALFLIPTFQNPTGIMTSLEKRKALLDISRRYGVPIIEDDCCSELRFRGKRVPSIKSLSEDGDLVYYICGMGKAYIPGMRLGFAACPPGHLDEIVKRKSVADLHTLPLMQSAFGRYLKTEACVANIKSVCRKYGEALDAVHHELEASMPDGCVFSKPEGGLNIWVRLPDGVDATELFFSGLQKNVSILVGSHLYPDLPDSRTFRLSFGYPDKERVAAGVRALGKAAGSLLRRSTGRFPVLV